MLTSEEVRNLTPSDITPRITHANCKPGVDPDEILQLIAESRAKTFGRRGIAEARSAYAKLSVRGNEALTVVQAPAPAAPKPNLTELSVF
jgi:hypothetical protein